MKLYDAIAPKYDHLFTDDRALQENEFIFSRISQYVSASAEILDIGCGTGLFLDYLGKFIAPDNYHGIDPSFEMLLQLRRKHPGYDNLYSCRFEELKLQRFDLIVSLFGSISYVDPLCSINIPGRVSDGGKYFLMFYKPDYEPETYKKTGIDMTHHTPGRPYLEQYFHNVFPYNNFLITTNIPL